MSALAALVATVEQRLLKRGIGRPPNAFLLGRQRLALIDALQQRLLESVGALHWKSFYRLAPQWCAKGMDGVLASVALSLPEAVASGLTAEILEPSDPNAAPQPPSVFFRRLTRPTGGHVVFRSQLLRLADAEFGTTPLEMNSLLERHTPAAIRAMLQARLIKGRPDLDSAARQALLFHATRHLGRLLPEADAAQQTLLLLRLAYYRLHHDTVTRPVLRRLRIVDFKERRRGTARERTRPAGER